MTVDSGSASRLVEAPEDASDFFDFAYENGWSDGLPVIPPTAARVDSFVEYVGRDADEVVAQLAPSGGEATIRNIATNAVMAGCRPEYLPVVIAAVQAVAVPSFDLHSIQVDVNASTVLVVVNGPIRDSIGMNYGGDALGGSNRANATIGRALRLTLRNVGEARPPFSDVAIHGQPGKISMCLAEDEAGNPWEPWHVERGFDASESVVTVAGVTGTQNIITGVHPRDGMLALIGDSITTLGSNGVLLGTWAHGGPVVSFSRGLARLFAKDGMSKQDVQQGIYECCQKPKAQMPPTMRPSRMDQVIQHDDAVWGVREPSQINIVIAGYDSPNHVCLMPNYGVSSIISKQIDIPS